MHRDHAISSKGFFIRPIPNQPKGPKFDLSDDHIFNNPVKKIRPVINVLGGTSIGISIGLAICIVFILGGITFSFTDLSLLLGIPIVLGAIAGFIVFN